LDRRRGRLRLDERCADERSLAPIEKLRERLRDRQADLGALADERLETLAGHPPEADVGRRPDRAGPPRQQEPELAEVRGGGHVGDLDLARVGVDRYTDAALLACLTVHERLAIAGKMRPRHFARDEIVFHRDDEAGQVFLIVAGTVKVSVPDETGREVVIALERGGDVFGELALFDEATRSATVTAITDTSAL